MEIASRTWDVRNPIAIDDQIDCDVSDLCSGRPNRGSPLHPLTIMASLPPTPLAKRCSLVADTGSRHAAKTCQPSGAYRHANLNVNHRY